MRLRRNCARRFTGASVVLGVCSMALRMLAVFLADAVFAAGTSAQDKGKTDEERFEGAWVFARLESMGMDAPEEVVKDATVAFTAGKVKVKMKGEEMELGFKL